MTHAKRSCWQEARIVTVAPLSDERVGPFTGDRPYLTTGGLQDTQIDHLESVAYENRPTRADLVVRAGDVIVARMKDTVKVLRVSRNHNGMIVSTGFAVFRPAPIVSPDYLYYFLRTPRFQELKDKYAQGSTQKAVNNTDLKTITLPLPPLPVQERIASILQKADDVVQQRRRALDLADAILPAAFICMFGNPRSNHTSFERVLLSGIADVRSGVTKGRKLRGRDTVEVPYLRVANVQDGFLDLAEMKTIEVLPEDVEKYHLEDGDILMTEGGDPDKLGRGAVWRNQIDNCIHQNHVFRVRTDRQRLAPEYLAALLRTQYAKQYFLSCAKRSSNLASVNSTQVKVFQVPLPSLSLQQKFVSAVEQWVEATERLVGALKDARNLFASTMDQAFRGDLTAKWEAANAENISRQVEFVKRLPQLLLLALLFERTKRAGQHSAEVLVTAVMKYAFLLQMEGNGRRRFYCFVPYHYGPFAKELYTDLQRLQDEGLVRVDNESDEDKVKITLTDPAKAEQALAELPADLRDDATAIIETYGHLDHSALLRTVYEKYPAYAKKSRLRKRKEGKPR